MATLRRYIQDFRLRPQDRPDLAFSDTAKIHMYGDAIRPGVRLRATGNANARKMEYPLDTREWRTQALSTPQVRQRSAVAYDSTRKELVIFGGLGSPSRRNDTWVYDGVSYTEKSPMGQKPSARDNHAMAYDVGRDKTVLFGGDDGSISSETWEWDGTNWTEITPVTSPSAREGMAMVYDPLRAKVLLFGGLTGSGASSELWEWDGTNWALVDSGAPTLARYSAAFALDSERGVLFVFGGLDTSGNHLADTWIYHSVRGWVQLSLQSLTPSARAKTVSWYDPLYRVIKIFGGEDSSAAVLGETWEWNGSSYSDVTAESTPPSDRLDVAGDYMTHIRRAVLVGGADAMAAKLNDHWEHALSPGQTVSLEQWAPQAVKQWLAFEEVSTKPDKTDIFWQVSDGTTTYYHNGIGWVAAGDYDWNSEDETADNLATFPATPKTIRPVARLFTADKFATPVLTEHRVMFAGLFDSWEDFLVSFSTALQDNTSFFTAVARVADRNYNSINLGNNQLFTFPQSLNLLDVDAVYNHTTDPNHDTDILSSYNPSNNTVAFTTSVLPGNAIWLRLKVAPEIVINYANAEYVEVGKTPAIIVDTIQAMGTDDTTFKRDLTHKSAELGHRLENPILIREMLLTMSLHTATIQDWSRLLADVQTLPKKLGGVLRSEALDVEWSITLTKRLLSYSPKPDFTDLKTASYELCVKDVHMWLSDVVDKPVILNLVSTFKRREVAGPFLSAPEPTPSGQIAQIQQAPVIETG